MEILVTKSSKRTLRTVCERCKIESDYYWAMSDSTGRRVLLDQGPLNEGLGLVGKRVPSSTVHKCFRRDAGFLTTEDGTHFVNPVEHVTPAAPAANVPATAPAAPAAVAIPTTGDDKQAAQMQKLFKLMGEVIGGQVDMDEVQAMIDARVVAEVDRIAHPTKTVVTNAQTGVTTVIAGSTHEQLADVIGFLDDGHVYLQGPAGTGKSYMANQAADARETEFWSILMTQQTPVSALAGYMDANRNYSRTGFRDAVEFGHVALIDEIDHGHANTVSFVNAATSNKRVGFPDGMVTVHPNFRVVAAANTFGTGQNALHTGATKLDAATLNRFGKLEILYDESLENEMLSSTGLDSSSQRKVLEFVRKVRHNAIKHPEFQVVASPRNSMRIAKALNRGVIWDKAVEVHLLAGIEADKRVKLLA